MNNLFKQKENIIHLELNYYDLYNLDKKNLNDTLFFLDKIFKTFKEIDDLPSFLTYFNSDFIEQSNKFTIKELKEKNVSLFLNINKSLKQQLFLENFENFIIETIDFLKKSNIATDYSFDPFSDSGLSSQAERSEEAIRSILLKKIEMFDINYNMKQRDENKKYKL